MKARNLAETKTAETKVVEDCDKAAKTTEKATSEKDCEGTLRIRTFCGYYTRPVNKYNQLAKK